MAYITPNSTIYLLKNVPFDRSYNHTVKWANASTQLNTLKASPFLKYTLTEQSYQRWKRDYIRVAMKCDLLYDCNYLVFQNTAYGNKWFYAFLDEPEYVNDNCSEIHYTIDVIQTWMFDIDVPPCFVEREHTLSDNIGSNLVPENLETGELQIYQSEDLYFPYMLGAIVTSKPLPTYAEVFVDQQISFEYRVRTQFVPDDFLFDPLLTHTDNPNGISNGLFIAYGFPVNDDDIINYWRANRSYYDIQDFDVTLNGTTEPLAGSGLTVGRLLSWIGSGKVTSKPPVGSPIGSLMSLDDVIAVYLYPAELNRNSNMSIAEGTYHYKKGTAISTFNIGNRPKYFILNNEGHYYPKNNKLFTYPYVQLLVSNNMADNATYRFEEIGKTTVDNETRCLFRWVGTFANKPMVSLVPELYKRETNNWEYSLSISDFPSPSFKGDQFTRYLESNSAKLNFGILSSVIGGVAKIGAPMPPAGNGGKGFNEMGTAIARGFTALNVAGEIGNTLATITDLRNAPPSVYGTYNNDVMNITTNRLGFKFYSLAIRGEFAEQIDDYFSMFGYAIKEVKIPNVFSSNTTHRRNWNYLKTIGCLVNSKTSSSGVPAFDLEQIQNILNKGITFWNYIGMVGSYDSPNDIIS